MTALFTTLITDLCAASGMTDSREVAAVVAGAPLMVEGVAVTLRHCYELAPERFSIYCDFGLPPRARQAECYRRLLEVNLAGYELDLGVFGMVSGSDRVVLSARFELPSMTVPALQEILTHLVERSRAFALSYRASPRSTGGLGESLQARLR